MQNDNQEHPDESPATDMLSLYELVMSPKNTPSLEETTSTTDELRALDKRYGQKKLVGQGGMKRVYLVDDRLTGRPVAMAFLNAQGDSSEQDRFLREARLTATLEHPNIMPIYDLGFNDEGAPFFTMKYTGDQNLYQLLKARYAKKPATPGGLKTDWPLLERLNIFINICEGIAYAHSRKILHLDLKPRNILVGKFGEVLICDWGLGKVLFDEDLETASAQEDIDPVFFHEISLKGHIKGTPGYMAPEQVDKSIGRRDHRTDIYALGGILHALLTGTPPVRGKTNQEIFEKTLAGRMVWSEFRQHKVPAALEAVTRKALACKRENRYQSVAALKEDILAFMGGFATSAENAGYFRNLCLLTSRYKAASTLTAILLLSSFIFSVFLYNSEQEARSNEKAARDMLNLYTAEKEQQRQQKKSTIEELIQLADESMDRRSLQRAITYANQVIALDPDHQDAWRIKGEGHFYLQEFKAAHAAMSQLPEGHLDSLRQLARKYGSMKADKKMLKAQDLIMLMDSVNLEQKQLLFAKHRNKYVDLSEHMTVVRYMLMATNPSQKMLHFDFKLTDDSILLDISGNTRTSSMDALLNLPLTVLNIENVPVDKVSFLNGMPLKELNIAGTSIRRLDFISRFSGMEKLTVSKGKYPHKIIRELRKKLTVIEK
jgi:serine/threonine protein kinase